MDESVGKIRRFFNQIERNFQSEICIYAITFDSDLWNRKKTREMKRNGRNWLDFGRLPVEKSQFVTTKDLPSNIFPSGEVK